VLLERSARRRPRSGDTLIAGVDVFAVEPMLRLRDAVPRGVLVWRWPEAVNTMDAMVGHRNERYGRFGWAAARLDDLATT